MVGVMARDASHSSRRRDSTAANAPPRDEPTTEVLEELLDRFECQWRQGVQPRLDDYVRPDMGTRRRELLGDLIQLDMHYRSLRGEPVALEDYRSSFGKQLDETVLFARTPDRVDWRRPDLAALSPAMQRVASIWPFSDLPWPVFRELALSLQPRTYAAGETLITQGEPICELIVLVSGDAEVRLRSSGRDQTLVPSPHARVLGEIGLLTTRISTVSVVAATLIEGFTLPAAKFHRLAQRYPVFRTAMFQLMARRLGKHEADALVGKILQGYRVLRCVGRGGMAAVYEAEDLESGERVALKMMSHALVDNPAAQARFQRELQLNRTLHHRGLLATSGAFAELGTQFLVLQFCPKPNLAELLESRPLSDEEIRSVAGQLADVVQWLHDRGICHRDLKPANVLFAANRHVKLADLGLAWSADCVDLTGQFDVLGTPCYMAPEQLHGGRPDYRADLFAFGCILWEMATGRRLFPGSSVLEILQAQANFTLPPRELIRPGLAPQIYAALERSLRCDPLQRDVSLNEIAAWGAPGG